MGITGAEVCDVAVLIGNRDFRIYTVYRDDAVISYLFGAGVAFWREYIEKDIMPPAVSLEDIENIHHGQQKERRFASEEITAAAKRYAEIDAEIKELKAERDRTNG
jgi:predicted phage-related endonuclease